VIREGNAYHKKHKGNKQHAGIIKPQDSINAANTERTTVATLNTPVQSLLSIGTARGTEPKGKNRR
jgi:uncharacterized phage protein gp47/JayE